MTHEGVWPRFGDELPACCAAAPLSLPRPSSAFLSAEADLNRGEEWRAGLSEWSLRVRVSWDDEDLDELGEAVDAHLDEHGVPEHNVPDALAAHGVRLDDDGSAWVGTQKLMMATLDSDLAGAAGRATISDGRDLWNAADEVAGDLEHLAGPLAPRPQDGDARWSNDVLSRWPDAEIAQSVVLLQSAVITPLLRGRLLGAWAAANAIALFDQGSTLVATLAAPLDLRDAIPGFTGGDSELTPDQSRLWNAERARLARHWQRRLGLTPLEADPNVLCWYSAFTNDALVETLGVWA